MTGCALASLGGCSRGFPDLHHVVPKSQLKSRFKHGGVWVNGRLEPLGRTALAEPEVTLDELIADTRNLVPCCRFHHAQLENRRLYLDPPDSAWEFAESIGLSSVLEKQRERRAA